jgi:CHAT domain-containing protein
LQNPRVLVVATHGSFQSDPGHDNLPSPNTAGFWGALLAGSPANRERSQSLINPLLRCNLALAGANHRLDAQGGNDGILTGMEILNTDLRGTDLVVLLACQTGLGAVEDGEGVAGLHHAFQLAGARTVLASLWSIPAQPSGKLVQAFLENLAIQPDKAMALRKAQLAMIAEQREKYGVAHPSLWAGLVLVGNARETIATKGKK